MSSEPHWLRTPWVVPALQPGCACSWCASERRQEAYREADARKQVNLALAAYGGNPYQSSLESGCTCPEGRHDSPYWTVHHIGCPERERLRVEWARKHVPAGGRQLRGPAHGVTPALPPDQEIRRELAAFDRWYVAFPQLPGWMQPGSAVPEPGRCHECFLGHAGTMTDLCIYCQLRVRVTRENDGHRELTAPASTVPSRLILVLFVMLLASWLWLVIGLIRGAL